MASTGRSTANIRTKAQIEADRAKIARLYLQGWTQYEIAQDMGLTRELVRYDLHAVQKAWRESALVDLNQKRAEELQRLDRIEREMWDAWERSKMAREITTARSRRVSIPGDPERLLNEATKRTEQRDPAARYMEIIMRCVEMRVKLLGLAADKDDPGAHQAAMITEIHYVADDGPEGGNVVIIGGRKPAPALPEPDDAPDPSQEMDLLDALASLPDEDLDLAAAFPSQIDGIAVRIEPAAPDPGPAPDPDPGADE